MLKKIAAMFAAALFAISSFAAVEANKGTAADLDGLKGVGPTMSKRIVDARAQGEFKDWPDFMHRVKGVKDKSATKLSAEGLTVNGQAYTPAPKGEGRKHGKKADASATTAAPASPAAVAAPAPAAPVAAAPAAPAAAAAVAPAVKAAVAPAVTSAATTAATAAAPAVAPAAKAVAGK